MQAEIIAFLVSAVGALALAARSLGKVSDSTASMASTVKTLNDELQETIKERRQWNQDRALLTGQMSDLLTQTTAQQQTIDDLERKLAQMSGAFDQAKVEIDLLKSQNEAQRATILNLETEIGRLHQQLEQANKAKAAAEARLEKERQETRAKLEALRAQLEGMRNGHEADPDRAPPSGESDHAENQTNQ